jgi:hypothetical protein
MSAIQAVLGSPPEPVVKEWLKLSNRQSMLSGVPESSSILVDKLDADFPPGTERLNGSIRHLLEYHLEERRTPEDCLQMLSHPVHCLLREFHQSKLPYRSRARSSPNCTLPKSATTSLCKSCAEMNKIR